MGVRSPNARWKCGRGGAIIDVLSSNGHELSHLKPIPLANLPHLHSRRLESFRRSKDNPRSGQLELSRTRATWPGTARLFGGFELGFAAPPTSNNDVGYASTAHRLCPPECSFASPAQSAARACWRWVLELMQLWGRGLELFDVARGYRLHRLPRSLVPASRAESTANLTRRSAFVLWAGNFAIRRRQTRRSRSPGPKKVPPAVGNACRRRAHSSSSLARSSALPSSMENASPLMRSKATEHYGLLRHDPPVGVRSSARSKAVFALDCSATSATSLCGRSRSAVSINVDAGLSARGCGKSSRLLHEAAIVRPLWLFEGRL